VDGSIIVDGSIMMIWSKMHSTAREHGVQQRGLSGNGRLRGRRRTWIRWSLWQDPGGPSELLQRAGTTNGSVSRGVVRDQVTARACSKDLR